MFVEASVDLSWGWVVTVEGQVLGLCLTKVRRGGAGGERGMEAV